MRPFIEQGDAILKACLDEGKTDYQRLATALKEQNAQFRGEVSQIPAINN